MKMETFNNIFNCSIAKVLDQASIVGNMEQTIATLSDITGLSYKTVQTALDKLEERGFVVKTRKIGNAQAYMFNMNKIKPYLELLMLSSLEE